MEKTFPGREITLGKGLSGCREGSPVVGFALVVCVHGGNLSRMTPRREGECDAGIPDPDRKSGGG